MHCYVKASQIKIVGRMKIVIILILLGFSYESYASCQDAYKAYKRSTLASPISAPMISSTHMAEGAVSTSGNVFYGASQSDTGLSTAGIANGLAFTYEGHYYIE